MRKLQATKEITATQSPQGSESSLLLSKPVLLSGVQSPLG